VIYSHHVIKTTDDLKLIKEYLFDEIDTIDTIMPSVSTYSVLDNYLYRNVKEAKKAFRDAVNDAIDEKLTLDLFLRYLRRFYIVTGLAQDDKEVGSKMRNLFDMAMYLKINKEE
tara:strand:+ start:770 stop:1111 length:342 start_codon:yes stop_codon:yes gene_type:complete